jgi:uncharacterized protein (DUF2147 family)
LGLRASRQAGELILLELFILAAAAAQAAPPDPLTGRWINSARSVIIRIAPCPDEGWCGAVEWASGRAAADAARGGTQTLVGSELLHGFVAIGPNRWKGRLFVPDLNKRSTAELRQLSPNQLKIRGCALGGLICKSQVWTRTE